MLHEYEAQSAKFGVLSTVWGLCKRHTVDVELRLERIFEMSD